MGEGGGGKTGCELVLLWEKTQRGRDEIVKDAHSNPQQIRGQKGNPNPEQGH